MTVPESAAWPSLQRAIESARPKPPRQSLLVRFKGKIIPGYRPPSAFALRDPVPPGIYILIYHSVIDPEHRRQWEQCYTKGEVTTAGFAKQLDWFLERMTPIRLGAAPEMLAKGMPDKPYFAVTFDDGFENVLRNALPITQTRNIYPTVFVNAAFARGEETFFRVLSAVLTATGGEKLLAKVLKSKIPDLPWSEDPVELFAQTRTFYRPEKMEQACEAAYQAHSGKRHDHLQCHLSVEDVRLMVEKGWEFGNHTYGHRNLSVLDQKEVFASIERNRDFWSQAGIDLIPFVGYPIGRTGDVNAYVGLWLRQNPQVHGIFANGGVNFLLHRTQWLRFGLGKKEGDAILTKVWQEILVSQQVLANAKFIDNP